MAPEPDSRIVVLDACVLYSAALRDLLMWLAVTDLFGARWTNQIHDEWTRNLAANRPDVRPEQLARVRRLMDGSIPNSLVTNYEVLIDRLTLPDADDRHVLAAAIHAGAGRIVTFNLSDFPRDQLAAFGIRAQHPDDFVVGLLDANPDLTCAAIAKQRASLIRPVVPVETLLDTFLKQGLPQLVNRLRPLAHRL